MEINYGTVHRIEVQNKLLRVLNIEIILKYV